MRCDRCGEMMRAETVIRLRRRFGMVQGCEQQGAWCMACGHRVSSPARPAQGQRRRSASGMLAWRMGQPDAVHDPVPAACRAGARAGGGKAAPRWSCLGRLMRALRAGTRLRGDAGPGDWLQGGQVSGLGRWSAGAGSARPRG